MLTAYCGALGIRPFDESFYDTAGQLVENVRITGNIRTEKRSGGGSEFNEEPMMSVEEVADGVVFMAAQPAHLNVLEMTMLPVEQPFLGRG